MKGRALALGGCILATLLPFAGTAGAQGPNQLSVDPPSFDFGSLCVGKSSASKTFTITNDGNQDANSISVSSDSGEFSETGPVDSTLSPHASTTFTARFSPSTRGQRGTALRVDSDDPEVPVNVTGIGIDRRLSADRPTVSFGNQRVKSRSPTQTLTLTNKGGDSVRVSNVARHGSGGRDFIVSAPAWPFSIPAGGTATVTIAFQPSAAGLRNGAVEFDSNACATPVLRVGLVGTGVLPKVAIDPNPVDVGASPSGVESAPTAVTVTNNGDAALKVTGVQITGVDADDFALKGLPVMPATIKPHDSFVFSVTMTPSEQGLRTAEIDVLSDDPDAPTLTVALTGNGGEQTSSPTPQPTRTRKPSPKPTTTLAAAGGTKRLSNDSLALGIVFAGVLAAFAGLLIVRRRMVAREED